ncbi:unnamed protein product [Miscanthus lutarioriparius]|uniref:Uncharacterized protein n=1 Tax=Miscanthus lutarioriparius TaxID=422564 RepID=A0A811MZB3_9POAL|nr:unnamed protein product [Miscanthus lutarioriparius]
MTTAGTIATMAMFLLVTLSASQMASSLRPHADLGLGTCRPSGYLPGRHCVKITANGNSVYAKVVDECDSVEGCDEDHNFEPPCDNNIVDASPAVWDALGLDQNVGMVDITWSEE